MNGILSKATFTWRDYKSIFDSKPRSITPRGKPMFVLSLRCVLFNNDGDDIDEVYMATCEKKNEVAQTRDARASQIERNGCFSFQLEDVMREKKRDLWFTYRANCLRRRSQTVVLNRNGKNHISLKSNWQHTRFARPCDTLVREMKKRVCAIRRSKGVNERKQSKSNESRRHSN